MTTTPKLARVAQIVLAIVLAIFGQILLSESGNTAAAIVIYLVAIALAVSAPDDPAPLTAPPHESFARGIFSARRCAFLIAGLLCAAMALALNADASFSVEDIPEFQFTFVGVLAWIASIALVLAALWRSEKTGAEWRELVRGRFEEWRGGISFHVTLTGLALIGIMVVARDVCPSNSWMYRMSAPFSSMSVAMVCRNAWHAPPLPPSPARST
jgi:hypothetical protein